MPALPCSRSNINAVLEELRRRRNLQLDDEQNGLGYVTIDNILYQQVSGVVGIAPSTVRLAVSFLVYYDFVQDSRLLRGAKGAPVRPRWIKLSGGVPNYPGGG